MVKKEFIFIISAVVLVLFSLNFVFSDVLVVKPVSGTSFTVNNATNYLYNITINNTDWILGVNFTQVNITFPSSFTFINSSTNGTSSKGILTIDTNTLSWLNISVGSQVVSNGTWKYFWINATSSLVGYHNLSIKTVDTDGILNSSEIVVRVQDTNNPVITLISPANVSTIEMGAWPYSVPFDYNVSDDSSRGITNCSLILNGEIGGFNSSVNNTGGQTSITNATSATSITWSINCTDSDNNIGNSSVFTFTFVNSTVVEEPSSGGSSATIFWTNSQGLLTSQLSQGYTKEYLAKHRVTFTIGSATHSMGVVSLTSTQATINVSSIPQQKVLSVGDEWKVEVTNDNYYDVSVKLNSIANSKANITLKSINELIPAATSPPTNNNLDSAQNADAPSDSGTTSGDNKIINYSILSEWWFWVILLAVVVIIFILVFLIKKKKRYYRKGY